MTTRLAPIERVAYKLHEAAEAVGVSVDVLRRAIHATDPNADPPPLDARRSSKSARFHYLVERPELERWFRSLPPA